MRILTLLTLSLVVLATLFSQTTRAQSASLAVENPPKQLTTDALAFFESRESLVVPWIHMEKWLKANEWENVAQAFESVAERDHWLKVYASHLHSADRHHGLAAYFAQHHPQYSIFNAEIGRLDEFRTELVRISHLNARSEADQNELRLILTPRKDLRDHALDIERSTKQIVALKSYIRTASNSDLASLTQEFFSGWMETQFARAAASLLFHSSNDEVRAYLAGQLESKGVGWSRIALAAIGSSPQLRQNLDWLQERQSGAEDPDVVQLIERRIKQGLRVHNMRKGSSSKSIPDKGGR